MSECWSLNPFLPLAPKVFKDANRLEKFMGLRSMYVIFIVGHAFKISSFSCNFSTGRTLSEVTETVKLLGEGRASEKELTELHQQVVFFDLAQSRSSWAISWSKLLQTPTKDLKDHMFQEVPVLKKMNWDTASKIRNRNLRSFLPNMMEEQAEAAEEIEKEQDAKQAEQDAEKKNVEAPVKSTTVVKVGDINKFSDLDCNGEAATRGLLDESMDAFSLKVCNLDAAFINLVQSKLQTLVWLQYRKHISKDSPANDICIDLSKKGTDQVVIPKDIARKEGFEMFMAGTVSMHPQGEIGKGHYPLCSLFGVNFFLNGPRDLGALDAVVPAWSTKVVTRNDQAFFELKSKKEKAFLYITADGTLQMQWASQVSDKFRKLVRLGKAFASATEDEKDQMQVRVEEFQETLEANEQEGIECANFRPWFGKAVDVPFADGLEFEVRFLGFSLFTFYFVGAGLVCWD